MVLYVGHLEIIHLACHFCTFKDRLFQCIICLSVQSVVRFTTCLTWSLCLFMQVKVVVSTLPKDLQTKRRKSIICLSTLAILCRGLCKSLYLTSSPKGLVFLVPPVSGKPL